MTRGFPLHLLAVGGVLIGMSVYLAVVASARSSALGVREAAAASGGATDENDVLPIAVSDRDERPSYRLSIETRDRGRLLSGDGSVTVPCRARSGALDLGAVATLVAGSGAAARPDQLDRVRGRHLVRFDLATEDRPALHRALDIHGDALLDVELTANVELRGRVLTASGAPIDGARVWMGEVVAGHRVEVTTDSAGSFRAFLRFGGPGVPVVVCADGFASVFSIVDVDRRGAELRLQLGAARRLDLRLAAAVAAAAEGVLRLAPSASAAQATALRQYPFFLQALEPTRLDADGRCEIVDLPTEGVVQVRVEHPEVALSHAVDVRLGQPHPRPVLIAAGPPTLRYRGRVVDASSDAAIVGADVAIDDGRAEPATHNDGWLLPAAHYRQGRRSTTTTADGRFDLPGSACADGRGRATILASAAGYFGVALSIEQETAHGGLSIALPAQPGGAAGSSDEAAPMLRFDLPTQGRRYLVQVNGGNWRVWDDRESFELSLVDSSIVDVTVVLEAAPGQPRIERRFPGTAVFGAVPLSLEF